MSVAQNGLKLPDRLRHPKALAGFSLARWYVAERYPQIAERKISVVNGFIAHQVACSGENLRHLIAIQPEREADYQKRRYNMTALQRAFGFSALAEVESQGIDVRADTSNSLYIEYTGRTKDPQIRCCYEIIGNCNAGTAMTQGSLEIHWYDIIKMHCELQQIPFATLRVKKVDVMKDALDWAMNGEPENKRITDDAYADALRSEWRWLYKENEIKWWLNPV